MPDYVARRVMAILNRDRKAVHGSRILVLGLAYKRNTGDARESPAPILCEQLHLLGADVRAVDPHIDPAKFPAHVHPAVLDGDELAAADLVIVTTDHDAFDLNLVVAQAQRVFDTRHRCPAAPTVEYL